MISKKLKQAIKQQLTLEADNEYDTRHKSSCEVWISNIEIIEDEDEINYTINLNDIESCYKSQQQVMAKLSEVINWAVKNNFITDGELTKGLYVPLK